MTHSGKFCFFSLIGKAALGNFSPGVLHLLLRDPGLSSPLETLHTISPSTIAYCISVLFSSRRVAHSKLKIHQCVHNFKGTDDSQFKSHEGK